jgi:hypothetical protein
MGCAASGKRWPVVPGRRPAARNPSSCTRTPRHSPGRSRGRPVPRIGERRGDTREPNSSPALASSEIFRRIPCPRLRWMTAVPATASHATAKRRRSIFVTLIFAPGAQPGRLPLPADHSGPQASWPDARRSALRAVYLEPPQSSARIGALAYRRPISRSSSVICLIEVSVRDPSAGPRSADGGSGRAPSAQ